MSKQDDIDKMMREIFEHQDSEVDLLQCRLDERERLIKFIKKYVSNKGIDKKAWQELEKEYELQERRKK